MNFSTKKPSVYKILHDEFGVEWEDHILITIGDTIHTKDPDIVRPDLLVHEKCHEVQQREMGIKEWWKRYLEDPRFRLDQECQAYKCQAIWLKKNLNDRNKRFKFIHSMAVDLSSEMYGKVISYNEAYKFLK